VVRPWETASVSATQPSDLWTKISNFLGMILLLVAVIGAAWMARRNMRLGRGDQQVHCASRST